MFKLECSDSVADLEQIVALQRRNHSSAVAPELWQDEGFVTIEYSVEKLQNMSGKYRHVVAKCDGIVVGYALVMLKECRATFPFLAPMFEEAEAAVFNGKPIRDTSYFVMGQVCVDQACRGKGLFRALYQALREQMRLEFDVVVTEVSTKNGRSLRAHQRVGFRNIDDNGIDAEEWRVIAWDWK